jgi:HAD superfamily hydrolase (TIGR01509 family)
MYIIDLDGTLIDSNGLWLEVDIEFLSRRGLEPTQEYEEMVARCIFPAAADYTKEYYHLPDSPQTIMEEWEKLALCHYTSLVPMKSGAEALLSACYDTGRGVALFTACRPMLCQAALERFDLTKYFDHVVYAEELGLDKHDPQCFVRLSERIGADPACCVLLDDSPSNCATAKTAGMTVIGVYDPCYARQQEDMERVCDRYVRSLEELIDQETGAFR